jgi:hypothetical protein
VSETTANQPGNGQDDAEQADTVGQPGGEQTAGTTEPESGEGEQKAE